MVDHEKIRRLQLEVVENLREVVDRTVKEPHARVTETRQEASDTERVLFGRRKRKSK